MSDGLAARWQALCARVPLRPGDLFAQIVRAYGGPDRHYHDLRHIAECLRSLDGVRGLSQDPVALELALWWHDFVYDTRASDNEERSADAAGKVLADAGLNGAVVDRVRELILITRHDREPRTPDQALIMDIDVAILGSAPSAFDVYEADVRREYAWVPEPIFWAKRAEILRGFLARPHLYQTDHFRSRLEAQARANLERSIARAG
jgi:predicted metal-dependent HD superfamily phosphohydrolase